MSISEIIDGASTWAMANLSIVIGGSVAIIALTIVCILTRQKRLTQIDRPAAAAENLSGSSLHKPLTEEKALSGSRPSTPMPIAAARFARRDGGSRHASRASLPQWSGRGVRARSLHRRTPHRRHDAARTGDHRPGPAPPTRRRRSGSSAFSSGVAARPASSTSSAASSRRPRRGTCCSCSANRPPSTSRPRPCSSAPRRPAAPPRPRPRP